MTFAIFSIFPSSVSIFSTLEKEIMLQAISLNLLDIKKVIILKWSKRFRNGLMETYIDVDGPIKIVKPGDGDCYRERDLAALSPQLADILRNLATKVTRQK